MTIQFAAIPLASLRETPKSLLLKACEETGFAPRRSWLAPSHQELLEYLRPALAENGYMLGAKVKTPSGVSLREYQGRASWPLYRPGHTPVLVTWDTGECKMSVNLTSPVYAPLRSVLPTVLSKAKAAASVSRVNSYNQVALCLMENAPIAPYCKIPKLGKDRFAIVVDTPESRRCRRFLQVVGMLKPGVFALEGDKPLRWLIEESRQAAHRYFDKAIGWTEIADRSHGELERMLDR